MNKYSFTSKDVAEHVNKFVSKRKTAFTLAEVLITLGIIGIVAAMTLPGLIGAWKDKQFKTAYKKAYADISVAFEGPIFNQELFRRETLFQQEATEQEFGIMKKKFKVITDCSDGKISPCWAKGDGLGNNFRYPTEDQSWCFTDISGRNWCTYYKGENIYVVDTNGLKGPNKFGKDRWIFTFVNKNLLRTNIGFDYVGLRAFITKDQTWKDGWCQYPPCYYQSWLLN